MKRSRIFLTVAAAGALGISWLGGTSFTKVRASNAPQTLPFSQNWANTSLITTTDDWSGVPGIVGYRGDDLTTSTGTDPSTILADGSGTPIDVNANQTNPNTFTSGGVSEFEITDPVVALQGSGTADAPHIVLYLNTTGQSNIRLQCNLRDIDGSGDDAVQPIAIQYRVGGTGDYTNVPGGFFADVTTGPDTATAITPVDLTLPAAANNQSILEIRIMTANAIGSDEWVGIDDIIVTAGAAPTPNKAFVDYNGDGKTDFSVVRNTGGGPTGQVTWFNAINGGAVEGYDWGLATDSFVPADYDGDGKDDIAIWRPGAAGVAAFYILESGTNSVRIDQFGQTGDNPKVIGDYDGDGKDDVAVYRAGATAEAPSTWFYKTSDVGVTNYVYWGKNGDFPASGDYDGDGKNDFVIQRNNGDGNAIFWMLYADFSTATTVFGLPTDVIVPGDYDGDGKTDLSVIRGQSGQLTWYQLPSSGGGLVTTSFGLSATDFVTPGDYDGDGKTDLAIWRPSGGGSNFWIQKSSDSSIQVFQFGSNGDYPVANFRTF